MDNARKWRSTGHLPSLSLSFGVASSNSGAVWNAPSDQLPALLPMARCSMLPSAPLWEHKHKQSSTQHSLQPCKVRAHFDELFAAGTLLLWLGEVTALPR
jgi:hypothetical protein